LRTAQNGDHPIAYQLLVSLLAGSGMRISEAFKIEKENKERGVRHVVVGKDCSIVALHSVTSGCVADLATDLNFIRQNLRILNAATEADPFIRAEYSEQSGPRAN
jgi:hypothetical protein